MPAYVFGIVAGYPVPIAAFGLYGNDAGAGVSAGPLGSHARSWLTEQATTEPVVGVEQLAALRAVRLPTPIYRFRVLGPIVERWPGWSFDGLRLTPRRPPHV